MPASQAVPSTTIPSFDVNFRKRFQESTREALPLLALNREGTICSMTRAARHSLKYAGDAEIEDCFFTHVHKRNMHRVMKDLADMVARGKRQATWLVRLHTGNRRWRWYRITAQNHLGGRDGRIYLRLRSL